MFFVTLTFDYEQQAFLDATRGQAEDRVLQFLKETAGIEHETFDELIEFGEPLASGTDWAIHDFTAHGLPEDHMAVWEHVLDLGLFKDCFPSVVDRREFVAQHTGWLLQLYERAGLDDGFDTEFLPWALTRFFYATLERVYTTKQALHVIEEEYANRTEGTPCVVAFDTLCGGWDCAKFADGPLEGTPFVYATKELADAEIEESDDFSVMLCDYIPGRRAVFYGS